MVDACVVVGLDLALVLVLLSFVSGDGVCVVDLCLVWVIVIVLFCCGVAC